MLKRICLCFMVLLLSISLISCNLGFLSTNSKNVGKTNSTVIKVASALEERMPEKYNAYLLYGVFAKLNSQGIGDLVFVYTDKRPDSVKYSDILIIVVDTRTGMIKKMDSPDYATYAALPYELVKKATPITVSQWTVDSDRAQKNAALSHAVDTDFSYNYVQFSATVQEGIEVYIIDHISLLGYKIYRSVVDAMTGDVMSSSILEI